MWASAPSTKWSTARLALSVFFWKVNAGCFFRRGSVYPGLYTRAPVLPLGSSSGGTAQMELYTPSRRGWGTAEALAAIAIPFSQSFNYKFFFRVWRVFNFFFFFNSQHNASKLQSS